MRINRQDLERLVDFLKKLTKRNFSLDKLSTGYRMVENENRDISPRLKPNALYEWLHAYKQAYLDCLDDNNIKYYDRIN